MASLAPRSPLYYPLGHTQEHQVDSQSTETGVGLSILIQEFAEAATVQYATVYWRTVCY